MEPTVKTGENLVFWELREVPEKRGGGFPKRRGERRWEVLRKAARKPVRKPTLTGTVPDVSRRVAEADTTVDENLEPRMKSVYAWCPVDLRDRRGCQRVPFEPYGGRPGTKREALPRWRVVGARLGHSGADGSSCTCGGAYCKPVWKVRTVPTASRRLGR